jgi:Leucine-rich repeat (LRR) protein
MRRLVFFLLLILASVFAYLIFSGDVNEWLCEDGEWVKYGHPMKPKPTVGCSLHEQFKSEILTRTEKIHKDSKLLNTLNYSNMELKRIPAEVLIDTEVKVLYLSNNNLTYLPKEIGDLTTLEELLIDQNRLAGPLSKEIGKLTNLYVLDMSQNLISSIPPEIGQLKKLKILDLNTNNLTTLPEEIFELEDNLEHLNLYGNNFSTDYIIMVQARLKKTSVNF